MGLLLFVLYGIISSASSQRIVRFEDLDGNIRYGDIVEGKEDHAKILRDQNIFAHHSGQRETDDNAIRIGRILSPLEDVPVIYAVGLNYPDHAHKVTNKSITSPIIFFKNRNAAIGPEEDVTIPLCSASPDYEAELGIIIKDTFRDATLDDALDHVLGYTAINDISGRCWQKSWSEAYNISTGAGGDFDICVGDGGQWTYSKSYDTHMPYGPVIVPPDVLGNASGLSITMHLNGKIMQNDTTSNMIFGVRQIIEFISRGTTIEAGTVIATGTMGGIGDTREPRVVLQDGDNVTVTIDSIGSLTNIVRRPRSKANLVKTSPVVVTPPSLTRSSNRIVRFLDANGNERYGALDAERAVSSNGVPTVIPGETVVRILRGDVFGPRTFTDEHAIVARLLPPIPKPPAVYAIGLNYADHAKASNMSVPLAPIVFFKNRMSIVGSGDDVIVPPTSTLPDYEAELAFVFGRTCKDVTRENALGCVLGYFVANDVSARCWQLSSAINKTGKQCLGNGGQWSYSKSFDTHCPLGPYLTVKDLVGGDASNLNVTMHLNGQQMQHASTSDLIFGVAELVEFVTKGTTVEKGTVVLTGTPAGVGFSRSPPVALKDGDVMEISIEGLGTIRNSVIRKG
eukprot:g503.t1